MISLKRQKSQKRSVFNTTTDGKHAWEKKESKSRISIHINAQKSASRKRDPRERYLNELPVKVWKFEFRVMESGVILDRSCTGATPRPCGTLSDTHYRLHTLTKTKASSAEVMKEDVPCFMMVKQTAWEKEIQPSWPMFQQDHHANRNQVAGTWFQRPGIISLWLQKRLRWLETSESYSNPLLCVVTASK